MVFLTSSIHLLLPCRVVYLRHSRFPQGHSGGCCTTRRASCAHRDRSLASGRRTPARANAPIRRWHILIHRVADSGSRLSFLHSRVARFGGVRLVPSSISWRSFLLPRPLLSVGRVPMTMTATPNHALQRTAPVGHAACSPQSPPRRHRARPPLSLRLGVVRRR